MSDLLKRAITELGLMACTEPDAKIREGIDKTITYLKALRENPTYTLVMHGGEVIADTRKR